MPHFKKLTPNLLVASVERSLAFYVDTLGFERGMTVPDTCTTGTRRDRGEAPTRAAMILIDTTPLVALCDARDSHHRVALKDLEALASARLGVCEAILMEACFHLPSGAQRHRLRAALDQLHMAALPRPDDRRFWLDALNWLSTYADHEPDWADGCLAVLRARREPERVDVRPRVPYDVATPRRDRDSDGCQWTLNPTEAVSIARRPSPLRRDARTSLQFVVSRLNRPGMLPTPKALPHSYCAGIARFGGASSYSCFPNAE